MSDRELNLIPAVMVSDIPCVSGIRYDSTKVIGGQYSTAGLGADTLYAVPMILVAPSRVYGAPIALDRIGIEVTTNAASTKLARLGLANYGTDGKPGALIVDGGEVLVDAIAGVENTIAATVYSGVPFFALVVSNSTPTLRGYSVVGNRAGLTSLTDTTQRLGWQRAFPYAALPDPFGGTPTQSSTMPRIIVRVA